MPIKFSIGSLLIGVLVASTECAVLLVLNESDLQHNAIVFISSLMFAFLVGSVAYDSTHARAFAFGAMPTFIMMAWVYYEELYSHPTYLQVAISSLIVVATGLVTLSMFHFAPLNHGQADSLKTKTRFSTLLGGIIIGMVLGGAVIVTFYCIEQPELEYQWKTHGGII